LQLSFRLKILEEVLTLFVGAPILQVVDDSKVHDLVFNNDWVTESFVWNIFLVWQVF